MEYLRGNAEVISKVQEIQEEGLAVSIISVAELYEGVFRSNNPAGKGNSVNDFLGAVWRDVQAEEWRLAFDYS